MIQDYIQQMIDNHYTKQHPSKPHKFAHSRPKNYFDLVQKIGIQGKYQTNLFYIFAIIWATSGIFILNIHMFFLSQRFSCLSTGLISRSCHEHICHLPRQQWDDFVAQDDKVSTTIAMQFGPYYCSDHVYLKTAKYISYLGAFVNLFLFSYIGDNIGRRKVLVLSMLELAVGSIILPISTNLIMATFGLFLCVGGATSSALITFPFLNQMFQNSKRQKYSILQLIIFSLFGILGTLFLYLVPNWRIFTVGFVAFPACLCLFLIWIYIQQTPLFLLRRQNSKSLKALNRIGKINFKIHQMLQEEDLISVKMQMQNNHQFNSIKINIINLLKYPSIRITLICCIAIGFTVSVQFYALSALLLQQSQNHIFLITFLIRLSEVSVYIPIYFFIQEIPRNTLGRIAFCASSIIAVLLMFLKKPSGQLEQVQTIVQIIFVFIHRSLTSIFVCYFYVYMSQLFPIKINAHILGYTTILIPFSVMLVQTVVRHEAILFIFTAIFSIISLAITLKLKKTKNCEMKYQIEQVQYLKNTKKQQQPVRASFRRSSLLKSLAL